mmetsp:Transcript_22805/g.48471  ORF Transcript_22805/g.48471 Transcript_22805/m.48471 type:complete len:268 (-) Transcript_22805:330-1133(-)
MRCDAIRCDGTEGIPSHRGFVALGLVRTQSCNTASRSLGLMRRAIPFVLGWMADAVLLRHRPIHHHRNSNPLSRRIGSLARIATSFRFARSVRLFPVLAFACSLSVCVCVVVVVVVGVVCVVVVARVGADRQTDTRTHGTLSEKVVLVFFRRRRIRRRFQVPRRGHPVGVVDVQAVVGPSFLLGPLLEEGLFLGPADRPVVFLLGSLDLVEASFLAPPQELLDAAELLRAGLFERPDAGVVPRHADPPDVLRSVETDLAVGHPVGLF